jgi:hypothetical protein
MNHFKQSKHLVQNFRNKDAILKRDGNYSLQFLFDDDDDDYDDDDDDDDNNNNNNKINYLHPVLQNSETMLRHIHSS